MIIPELQIITPEVFQQAQETYALRSQKKLPGRLSGKALLSGNIYCGHCGGRMFASTARRSHHKVNGENERISIYKCYNRAQYPGVCSGPTSYRAHRIDEMIHKQIDAHCAGRPSLKKFYQKFSTADHPVQKMILCQWLEKAIVSSYEQIDTLFQEEPDLF